MQLHPKDKAVSEEKVKLKICTSLFELKKRDPL